MPSSTQKIIYLQGLIYGRRFKGVSGLKVHIIFSMFSHGKPLTVENLKRRWILRPSRCPLCCATNETNTPIFGMCIHNLRLGVCIYWSGDENNILDLYSWSNSKSKSGYKCWSIFAWKCGQLKIEQIFRWWSFLPNVVENQERGQLFEIKSIQQKDIASIRERSTSLAKGIILNWNSLSKNSNKGTQAAQ